MTKHLTLCLAEDIWKCDEFSLDTLNLRCQKTFQMNIYLIRDVALELGKEVRAGQRIGNLFERTVVWS